jgi:hypothetical protein
MARKSSWRLLIPLTILLAGSLACGLGSAAPPMAAAPPTVAPAASPLATQSAPNPPPIPTLQPAVLEPRKLTLESPAAIRSGDTDVIRLTLEVDAQGNLTPTSEYGGHVTSGQTVYIPDVYATHTVLAEAHLELAGVQIDPAGMVSQPLLRGRSVTFYWSIRPGSEGHYRGVVWFYARFVPLEGGQESEQPLAVFPVEFDVVSFLGLKAGTARLLGAAGAFLSSILGIPFLEDGLRWLLKRFKRL